VWIKKAIEGGWLPRMSSTPAWLEKAVPGDKESQIELLSQLCTQDPYFWQALGKSLGWPEYNHLRRSYETESWYGKWHQFTDHLIAGNDPDSFFTGLLAK
jgi:hypothetical protein